MNSFVKINLWKILKNIVILLDKILNMQVQDES